jgi:hypothetical protein
MKARSLSGNLGHLGGALNRQMGKTYPCCLATNTKEFWPVTPKVNSHRDGSFVRMKRIILIDRILLEVWLALQGIAPGPGFLGHCRSGWLWPATLTSQCK